MAKIGKKYPSAINVDILNLIIRIGNCTTFVIIMYSFAINYNNPDKWRKIK